MARVFAVTAVMAVMTAMSSAFYSQPQYMYNIIPSLSPYVYPFDCFQRMQFCRNVEPMYFSTSTFWRPPMTYPYYDNGYYSTIDLTINPLFCEYNYEVADDTALVDPNAEDCCRNKTSGGCHRRGCRSKSSRNEGYGWSCSSGSRSYYDRCNSRCSNTGRSSKRNSRNFNRSRDNTRRYYQYQGTSSTFNPPTYSSFSFPESYFSFPSNVVW